MIKTNSSKKIRLEMKQTSFFPKIKKSFGPEDLEGKRKGERILSSRQALHLILKSDVIIEFGRFYKYKKIIAAELNKFSIKFGVRIYNYEINSDHIHLIIQIQNRELYNRFIAAFTGSVAKKIMFLNKVAALNPNKTLAPAKRADTNLTSPIYKIKFWKARPFTRIIEWGQDFNTLQNYLYQNKMESFGIANYKDRNASTIIERVKPFVDSMAFAEEELTYDEFMGTQLSLIKNDNTWEGKIPEV